MGAVLTLVGILKFPCKRVMENLLSGTLLWNAVGSLTYDSRINLSFSVCLAIHIKDRV